MAARDPRGERGGGLAAVAPHGNVFARFTLRSLSANRTRTVVSVMGIALACALITAVLTSVVSLSTALVGRTATDEGWWYGEVAGVTEDGLARLRSDSRVADWTGIAELGAVSLGDDNADLYGPYLYVRTWPGEQDDGQPLVRVPELMAGRVPEAPGEIVLPHYLQGVGLAPCGVSTADGGPLELGSVVTLDLGTRTVTSLADGTSVTATSMRGDYVDERSQSESYSADLGQVGGTVVGFYRSYGVSPTFAMRGNAAYVYDDGSALARAMGDGSDATWASVLFRTTDPADAADVAADVAGGGTQSVHTSLLRWMGVTPDTAIWNTLYQIAAILAAIVVVAGVSLVYNSFAISVAERTRQFGLLASLGASRRQLRRTVLTEALVIGGIGVPAGLALGLLGCVVVFGALGEGIGALVGETGARVVVSPAALALAAALGLLTLLVSAWVPARRASRVPAVDAIRQAQDVRLSRRARRAQRRAERRADRHDGAAGPSLGLAGRLLGVPGFVAHRNLARSSSKGRVTVAALAVSVALLVTSGSIADVLGYAVDTALDTLEGQDLLVSLDATGTGAGRSLARGDGQVDGPGLQEALARWYADATEATDASSNGYATLYLANALFPSSMVGDGIDRLYGGAGRLADGSWEGDAYVEFVDDASWEAYVAELGLPRDEFCDPAHPRAVLVDSYDVNDGQTYANVRPFTGPGTIRFLRFPTFDDGRWVSGLADGADGTPRATYFDEEGTERTMPYDEGVTGERDIEVGALADHAPACASVTSGPHLVLPSSAIALADTMGYSRASCSFDTGGDATRASEAQDALQAVAADHPELDATYTNVAEAKLQARLMVTTVNTFVACFAVITGLIAVANVFNTLANALILRRREFAVLRSVGMGGRAFRHMIAYECASYALRGFLVGLALATLAALGLWQAMATSYSTFELRLPWPQVGLAAVVVLAVIGASVAYALRRARAASVVEALRDDAL